MKRIILFGALLLLFVMPITADDKRPHYEPMDMQDLIQWYSSNVAKSMMDDAQSMKLISVLTLSESVPCFDVVISTEPSQPWNPFWHPIWTLDRTNCVDKRTYKCGDK